MHAGQFHKKTPDQQRDLACEVEKTQCDTMIIETTYDRRVTSSHRCCYRIENLS